MNTKAGARLSIALGLVAACAGVSCAQVIGIDHEYVSSGASGGGGSGGAEVMCKPGTSVACYSGPMDTVDVGACKQGTSACTETGDGFGPCVGEVVPQAEICGNEVDDNCDGAVNEMCPCQPGSSEPCYSGPLGTAGVGVCSAGTHVCMASGAGFGPCMGEVIPAPESCGTAQDEDCDGDAFEPLDADCTCVPGSTVACDTGLLGACAAGMGVCNANGQTVNVCNSQVKPSLDDCTTPADEDCDGAAAVCVGDPTVAVTDGDLGDDVVFAVRADSSGNMITGGVADGSVTGYTVNTGIFHLRKYGPAGAVLWSKYVSPGAQNHAVIRGAAIDSNDGVVVTGELRGSLVFGGAGQTLSSTGTNAPDFMLIRFNANGTYDWGRRIGDSSYQAGLRVAVDATDDVLVTGGFAGNMDFGSDFLSSVSDLDVFVAKLGSAGNTKWTKSFGAIGDQVGLGIVATPNDDVIIAGTFASTIPLGAGLVSSGGIDIFVARLSGADGTVMWAKQFGDFYDQSVYDLAIDAAGNIAITGAFKGTVNFGGVALTNADITNQTSDVFVAKLSGADGSHLWSQRFGDARDQVGEGIAMDAAGNVSVTGYFKGTMNMGGVDLISAGGMFGGTDVFAARFASAAPGTHLWSRRFGDDSDQNGWAADVDSAGQTLIGGGFEATIDFGQPAGSLTSVSQIDEFAVRLSP